MSIQGPGSPIYRSSESYDSSSGSDDGDLEYNMGYNSPLEIADSEGEESLAIRNASLEIDYDEDILVYQKLLREKQNIEYCSCLTDDIVKLIFMRFSETEFNDSYELWDQKIPLKQRSVGDFKERLLAFSCFSLTCKKTYMISHEIPHEKFNGMITTHKANDFVLIRSLPFRLCMREIEKQKENKSEIIDKLHKIYIRGIDPQNIKKLTCYTFSVLYSINECNIEKDKKNEARCYLRDIAFNSLIKNTADRLGESLWAEDYKSALDNFSAQFSNELCPGSDAEYCSTDSVNLRISNRRVIAFHLRRTLYKRHSAHFQKLAEEFKEPEDKIISLQEKMHTCLLKERADIEAGCKKTLKKICKVNAILTSGETDPDALYFLKKLLPPLINILKPFAEFPVEIISTLNQKEEIEIFLPAHRNRLIGGRLYEIHRALGNLFENATKTAKQLSSFYAELSKPVPNEGRKKQKRIKALEKIIGD